jgi:hypothetical protein
MKVKIVILLLFLSIKVGYAQMSYAAIIKKAEKLAQNETESLQQKEALNLYENAFKSFPDSINDFSVYNASLLASKFKHYDKAFKYVTYLSEIIEDEEGYPGWDYIIGEYANEDYKEIINDVRWQELKKKALKNKQLFFENLKNDENEFFDVFEINIPKKLKGKQLYSYLKTQNPYKEKRKQNYSISFKINDSLKTAYYISLPKNYNPNKAYSVLVFLHGAIRHTKFSEYETNSNLKYWNRFYTKYAIKNDVILVFPKANKEYNWMTSDKGFFIVPAIVKQLKKAININDNKIFITGHSNGATGSFSYLIKQPTQFAGFYGFNTEPKVYTGGTFIENVLNRSFINFSTDQDYYFPPNANDSLNKLMDSINADYKDYRYKGFPHWFPQFNESEPAYQILFSDLTKRERIPFKNKLTWEFDDDNYGDIDWLSNIKLDTLKPKKEWHKEINFEIDTWLKYDKNDSLVTINVNKKAFDFPRKSGKIIAEYNNNVFKIKTSGIKSFQINIAPEMVNMNKKIKIFVNDKCYFNKKVSYNSKFMLKNFEENNDRKQVWVTTIEIPL